MKLLTKIIGIILFTSIFLAKQVQAQHANVEAFLEKSTIEIGDQVNLILRVTVPENTKISFPVIKDTLTSDIEVISKSGIDTIKNQKGIVLTQKILITCFIDSTLIIPSLNFKNGDKAIITQPIYLNVQKVKLDSAYINKIDTTKALAIFDIKPPYDAPWTFNEFWQTYKMYIWGFVGLALVVAFVIYYINRRKKNKPILKIERPKDPAFVIALRKLDELKNKKLWQQDKVKEYHTELTDIIRQYIEEQYFISTLEQTSFEILNSIETSKKFDDQSVDLLRSMLLIADMVKFAKMLPLPNENDLSLQNAYSFIEQTKPKNGNGNEKKELNVELTEVPKNE